jgi:hypothetical protein
MSCGNRIYCILECIVPVVRGFLLLRPIMADAENQRHPRPKMGDSYLQRGTRGLAEAWVPILDHWVRWTGGKIPSART